MSGEAARGAVAFAEKVLELLDEGRYTATYKYAVLLAMIDLCLDHADRSGEPPSVLTTPELAARVVELYWPHAAPYPDHPPARVLRQNVGGQAEIVAAVADFRARHAPVAATPWKARSAAPREYERLVRFVEWKLVQMPLPRLQTMGTATEEFIYRIHWTRAVRRAEVQAYQEGRASDFDNRVVLLPGVGQYLRDLNGLLRPLIHRKWVEMVAAVNGLPEMRLQEFLFGKDRVDTGPVRAPLWELQERRCFYCGGRIREPVGAVVDHFIPWARYADDGLDNLVVADDRCNGWKSASLAASDHVARWAARFSPGPTAAGLEAVASTTGWIRDVRRTHGAGRAIYLGLPETAMLWLRRKEFVPLDRETVVRALSPDH